MMPTAASGVRTPARSSALLLTVRVLLGVLGAAKLAGTGYFTFFASVEEGGVTTAGDWVVAGWSLLISVGFLVAAATLRPGNRPMFRALVVLLLADLAFGLVKLIGYRETEALAFTGVSLLLLGLVTVAGRRPQ